MSEVIMGAQIPVAAAQESKGKFFPHLHAFRGFAIIAIVLCHGLSAGYMFAGGEQGPASMKVYFHLMETINHDSTIFFAIISGLLFSLVLEPRGWTSFFRSKALYVVTPYIIISAMFTGLSVLDPRSEVKDFSDYLLALFKNVLTGESFGHLWYIPVLVILYVLTPLIVWILDNPKLKWLMWVLFAAPLVASRVWPEFTFTTPIYFAGVYAIGIYVGRNYEFMLNAFEARKNLLMFFAVYTSIVLMVCYTIEVEMFGFVSVRESIFYIQKLCISALVLVWLKNLEGRTPAWLDRLADYAFPIYFLHFIPLIFVYVGFVHGLKIPTNVVTMFLVGSLATVVGLYVPMAISYGLKKLLKKKSRLILGA